MARFFFAAATAILCARANKAPLPSVETVLTKATSKAVDFAQQAAAMQQKLDEQQEMSRAALHEQKQEYEHLLQAQSNQSNAIRRQNKELQEGNNQLAQLNTQMVASLRELSKKNAGMRDDLSNISSKVSAAKLFLADSLKITDDSRATELAVLNPTTPKPTLDQFLAVTRNDKVSLLALGSTRMAGHPEELVAALSSSLSEIATAQQEGAAELKAHFLTSFNLGEKQQAELNVTHAALLQTQAALKERRAKLLEAKSHLEATHKDLTERLRAVRAFASKVDSAVLASLHPQTPQTNNTKANVSAPVANATLKQEVKAVPVRATKKSAKATVKSARDARSFLKITDRQASVSADSTKEPKAKEAPTSVNVSKAAPASDTLNAVKQWLSSKLR